MSIFSSRKVGGYVHYFRMEAFWESLSIDEKNQVIEWSGDSLVNGVISGTSQTPAGLMIGIASYAISAKQYALALKLLNYAETTNPTPLDLHFVYNSLIKACYKQRNEPQFLAMTEDYCTKDILLFPRYKQPVIALCGALPNCPSFQQLAIIYEKSNKIQQALDVCNAAIYNGLNSDGAFSKRIETLKKKHNNK